MALFLKTKKLKVSTGSRLVVVLKDDDAFHYGIQVDDKIEIKFSRNKTLIANVEYSSTIKSGYVGLYKEIWDRYDIDTEDIVEIKLVSRPLSIEAIKKKILGKELNYDEIYSIMKDISEGRLGEVEMTYFTMTSFIHPYTDNELYYLTKAMAETGETMNLPEKVVDKHCIGGLAGNRTTMLVIPIIASLGLKIPKTSSRAITSPSGTADTMEVLANVSFPIKDIKKIINKTNACLVWGGGLNMAPADDKIIKVSRPLAMEPYDKMIVSILAKKVAMGVDHLIIDIPVGKTAKVPNKKIGVLIGEKFVRIAKKFNIKLAYNISSAREPIGRGIGPALEARDVLRVLQQKKNKPKDLENKAAHLAGLLLELKGYCKKGQGKSIALQQLKNGEAWKKMNEIIIAQGGKEDIDSEKIIKKVYKHHVKADKSGKVLFINNKAINEVCMNLGTPRDKMSGIHMHCKFGEKIKKGNILFTLYASSKERIELGIKAIAKNKIIYLNKKGLEKFRKVKKVPGILLGQEGDCR